RVAERLELLLQRELERTGRKGKAARGLAGALAELRERLELLRTAARRSKDAQRQEPPSPGRDLDAGNRRHDLAGVPPVAQPVAEGPPVGRDRLRVGVLPFLAHGSERREGDLAFSLSQEIAAGLARFRWFDVIAPIALQPTPSIRFIDEHQLRARGLDYVVE